MIRPKCIAFDCFGTVFDMSGVSRDEINTYVEHVNKADFTPFKFPATWWQLKAHVDSAEGIARLQESGIRCVALSNGSHDLINDISRRSGIEWYCIVNLIKHRVYKPHIDAYRTIEKELGFKPAETLMVTANPSFGDLEGAESIGMSSMVIRATGYPIRNTIALAEHFGC